MWAMLVNILNFSFTIAVVIIANYIMLLGIRDIIFFIVPGPGGRKPFNLSPGKSGLFAIIKRIVFWLAFLAVCAVFMYLIIPFLLFVIIGRVIYSAGRSLRIRPPMMTLLSASLMLAITLIHIRSQPVIVKFGNQFSADMWIYNTGNSLLELMMRAAMQMGISTSGIEYLAGLIPHVQKNMYGFLILSIYIFSSVLTGKLSIIFLKGRSLELPPYFVVSPVKFFPVVALLVVAGGHYADMGPALFVICGIYYAWGVNLLIYSLKGGHWAFNMVLLVAGAMHPVSIVLFVVLGVLDNLLDLRRMGALLGVKPRFE